MQVVIAVLSVVLFFFWLFEPGWEIVKILGLISSTCLCLSMIISYRAEEKNKKKE